MEEKKISCSTSEKRKNEQITMEVTAFFRVCSKYICTYACIPLSNFSSLNCNSSLLGYNKKIIAGQLVSDGALKKTTSKFHFYLKIKACISHPRLLRLCSLTQSSALLFP